MKRRSLIILSIALIAVSIICLYLYAGDAIIVSIESLVPIQTEIQTTQPQNQPTNITDKKLISDSLLNTLTEQEQTAYDDIYSALSRRKDSVTIHPVLENERVFELVQLVLSLHPEIFWSKADCTYASNGILTLKYIYSRDEIEEKNLLIEKRAQEIFSEINPTGTEAEKSLAIFDYIVSNTSYEYKAIEDTENYMYASTIEGVFLYSDAICSGYAKAYQYLLAMAGIDAVMILGTAQTPEGEGGHAWVAQLADGEIYFTDPTWGDCFEDTSNGNMVSHIYFMISDDEISKTHTPSELFSAVKSTEKQSAYFVNNGLYLQECDYSQIRNIVKESLENGDNGIELKFADDEAYNYAKTYLLDKANIYIILMSVDLLSGRVDSDKLSYSCNDNFRVITIFYEFK